MIEPKAIDGMLRLLPGRPKILPALKTCLVPTPAHNGVAKRTAMGATIQKASSN
jgi:hypothetical protein